MATTVNLATCFQYPNPANGDLVIKANPDDYLQLVGIKVCNLVNQTNIQNNIISQILGKIVELQNKQSIPYVLPSLFPTSIANPNVSLILDEFTRILEEQFGQLRSATGNPQQIYSGITKLPNNINTSKALGSTGGNLSSLPGWSPVISNVADAIGNAFIMITDLRSAIRNIQLTAGSICEGVAVVLQGVLQVKFLKLYFTGTIPENLVSCLTVGAAFKIQDNSGNFVNYNINIKDNLNISSGLGIDLSGTPLNFADDLKISGIMSLCDNNTGTQCQKYLEEIIVNTGSCPTLSTTSGFTSIGYNFTHTDGILTYSVQLFDQSNVMIQSRNVNVSSTIVVSGSFNDLTVQTAYKIRLQIITSTSTKNCPFLPVSTLANPCADPNNVEAVINL